MRLRRLHHVDIYPFVFISFLYLREEILPLIITAWWSCNIICLLSYITTIMSRFLRSVVVHQISKLKMSRIIFEPEFSLKYYFAVKNDDLRSIFSTFSYISAFMTKDETSYSEDHCVIKIHAALIDSTNYSDERAWKAYRWRHRQCHYVVAV